MEADWIAQARDGSHEAFSRILREHQASVRGYLSRFVRNDDLVDDLAQETFIAAFRGLAGYRGDASLRTWLLGIARKMALRYLEDLKKRGAARLEPELAAWLLQVADNPARQDQELAALDLCVKRLPPQSAQLVEDFYTKRRTAAAIASSTGRKEGAVWMALLRVREALRQCVTSRLEPTP